MEKKIIELIKDDSGCGCLTCGVNNATVKVKIQRIHCEDNITSFYICDECLVRIQKDVHKICE